MSVVSVSSLLWRNLLRGTASSREHGCRLVTSVRCGAHFFFAPSSHVPRMTGRYRERVARQSCSRSRFTRKFLRIVQPSVTEAVQSEAARSGSRLAGHASRPATARVSRLYPERCSRMVSAVPATSSCTCFWRLVAARVELEGRARARMKGRSVGSWRPTLAGHASRRAHWVSGRSQATRLVAKVVERDLDPLNVSDEPTRGYYRSEDWADKASHLPYPEYL